MSTGGETPRLKSPLERALLRAFADVGPNLTALGACPSAPFMCNGDKHRAAAGWWIIFACDVTITCEDGVAVDGEHGDVAELRLVPSGKGVMEGLAWSWRLMLVRTMAIGRPNDARLLMTDSAPYPEPVSNLVSYHSLVVCRDELCSRIARELNASCDAAFEGRSFAGFAMDMAWGSLTSVFEMGKEQPQYEEPQAAQEEAIAQAPAGAAAVAAVPGRPAAHTAFAADATQAQGGAGGAGLQALAENEVLASFDPPTRSSAGPSLGVGLEGASLPIEGLGVAPDAAAQGRKPEWDGRPATAELFSDFLSYRSPRAELPPQSNGAEAAADVLVPAGADFEDKLDILRGKLPDRSSQELRKLLQQADADVGKVLAMFA